MNAIDDRASRAVQQAHPPEPARPSPKLAIAASITSGLAWLSLGLALGCLAVEGYSIARWGTWSGPRLSESLRAEGLKLPRASWVGVEQALEWILAQSIFIFGAAAFLALATGLAATALAVRRIQSMARVHDIARLRPPLAATELPVQPASDGHFCIESAYKALDRRSEEKPGD